MICGQDRMQKGRKPSEVVVTAAKRREEMRKEVRTRERRIRERRMTRMT